MQILDLVPGKGKRNRSGNAIMGDPCSDGIHGSTSILQFNKSPPVVNLNIQWVPSNVSSKSSSLKTWGNTLTGLDLSVSVSQFVDLNGGNSNEHLSKTLHRKRFHGIEWGHGLKVGKFDVLGDTEVLVWGEFVEGNSQLVESKSNCGNHSGTSVLELSSTHEFSSFLRSPIFCDVVPVSLSEEDGFSS